MYSGEPDLVKEGEEVLRSGKGERGLRLEDGGLKLEAEGEMPNEK
jgi:hypothetical protein